MSTLHLMHCQPDSRKFVSWAARHKLLPPGGDLGYAFHAALAAVFGPHAPKPFHYRDERAGLLAYTSSSIEALRDASAMCAAPDLADALGLDPGPHSAGLSVRAFPTQWQTGRVLGFETRIRPMQRHKVEGRKYGNERDAFRDLPDAADPDLRAKPLQREAVYAQWLAKQFEATGAAQLVDAHMTRFQLTPVLRRTQAGASGGASRVTRIVSGPDAVFHGHLRVADPDAFARLLMRGIGRHRSFGFGMLLLRPASIGT